MSFTEFETARIEGKVAAYVARKRPRPEIRHKVDLAFRLDDQSIEIFEIRPSFRDESVKNEESVAKTTYVRRAHEWRIYWQRADLKWHRYEPTPDASSIEEFLTLIEEDKHGCFWG